ncbi:chromate transporter [Ideonella sp.]|uniref:chromate transporter n=1 Tax=Ideonella sp. TaxID=1929293 RepID=UPI0035AE7779
MADGAAAPARPAPAGCTDLFLAFSRLALQGFGGVLPIAQRELVERLGWLTREEFAEALSVGQVLPGPNVVNLSLMVGDRYFGLRGALAALAGMLVLPMALVLVMAAVHGQLADVPAVAGAVRGMGIVSAGLIFAMGLKLVPTLAGHPLGRAGWVAVSAAVLLTVAVWRWPLVAVIAGVGGLSCALTAWRLRRTAADGGGR